MEYVKPVVPLHTVVTPEITPGCAGCEFTVMVLALWAPVPQPLVGVTATSPPDVPNFTVMGDARRGRRPSFTGAASPGQARGVFDYFVNRLAQSGLRVQTGCFGAHMHILSVADGPVNVIIDSPPPQEEAPAIQPPADNAQAPAPGPSHRAQSTGAEPLAQPPGAAGDSAPGGESQTT